MESYSVQEVLKRAEDLCSQFEMELSKQFYEKAIEMEPENLQALNGLGEVLVELGEEEKATLMFKKSIELEPEKGHAKYMNMGQILEGIDAVKMYQKGLEIIRKKIESLEKDTTAEGKKTEHLLRQRIARGCCAIVEIYMTDACYENEAEESCQRYLDEAIKWGGETFPEVLQLYASFRLCQQNREDALILARRSYILWKDAPDHSIPTFDSRLQTAKLFIELEEYNSAVEILEGLVAEMDNIAEVWYLLGMALHGSNNMCGSLEALEQAQELLLKYPEGVPEEFKTQISELIAIVTPLADKEEEEEKGEKEKQSKNKKDDEEEEEMNIENSGK